MENEHEMESEMGKTSAAEEHIEDKATVMVAEPGHSTMEVCSGVVGGGGGGGRGGVQGPTLV